MALQDENPHWTANVENAPMAETTGLDFAVYQIITDMRKEINDNHTSFREEYLTAQEVFRRDIVNLTAGQAEISAVQRSILERVNKTNGFVGEHEGVLKMHTGMLNGISDEFKHISEKLDEQVELCKVTRQTALPRLAAIETRNVQQDAAEDGKQRSAGVKIKNAALAKIVDQIVGSLWILIGLGAWALIKTYVK